MLVNQTIEKLHALRLKGMASAFEEQRAMPDVSSMSFEERFSLLIDREESERSNRRYQRRVKKAALKEQAQIEDIDFRKKRGLDKSVVMSLAGCDWIRNHQNVIITGPTGVGKTYIGCALLHKACVEGFTAKYLRVPRLLHELTIARSDGSYTDVMAAYAKTDLLLLDDWGLSQLAVSEARDFLELIDDRNGTRSTILTSQVPPEKWHELIKDPTLADAIMDRLIHRSHKLSLDGPSMRKRADELTSGKK